MRNLTVLCVAFAFPLLFGSMNAARADSELGPGETLRIAAGSAVGFQDDDGVKWSADQGFSGGKGIDYGTKQLILSNRAPQVYRHERSGVKAFSRPLRNGRYTVVFHFVENDPRFFGKAKRLVSIDVEGARYKDLDIWNVTTGQHVPLVYSVPVLLTDGTLNVSFSAGKGRTTVSGLEITAAAVPGAAPPIPGEQTVVLSPSDYSGNNDRLQAAARSDDRSSFIKPSLEKNSEQKTGLPGDWSLRVDYTVNALMAYSDHAYFTIDTPVDLSGKKSIALWVRPDGTGRQLKLYLKAADGTQGSISLMMTGTEPQLLRVPLQNMGRRTSYATPSGGNLATKLESVRVDVGANSILGGGALYLGPIVASTEPAPPVPQPSGPDHLVVEGEPARFKIDSFENYRSTEDLRSHYGFIAHEGMSIVRLQGDHKVEGKQAMRVDYSFGKRNQSGVSMVRQFDLEKYNVLRFWMRGDGSANRMRIFDASGGYFKTEFAMPGPEGRLVELPFSEWIGFSAKKKGALEFGFWVYQNSAVNEGTIYIDALEFANDPKFPQGFAQLPAPVPLPGNKISRIDAGSDVDRKDGDGKQWLSDRGYYWGRSKVWGKDEPTEFKGPWRKLFLDERYGMAGYGFTVPNGDYFVHLVFVEPWVGAMAPGRRVCGISVNEQQQRDLDMFAEIGKRFVPVIRKTALKVTDGKIDIRFRDVKTHCKLDGIIVIPAALAQPGDKPS